MEKIDKAIYEFKKIEELSDQSSPIHSLHPLSKMFAVGLYLIITVSFGKYDLGGVVLMSVFPLFLFYASDISMAYFFKRVWILLPFIALIGIFNPIFDRKTALIIGSLAVSGGTISFLTLMIKGMLCLMGSFILIGTTSIDSICRGLRKVKCPALLVCLLLLTYRYISVMMEEISVMTTAYKLRAPGQKGLHISSWGSFLGQLFLRSADRASELYASMQLRGFNGEFLYAKEEKPSAKDFIFAAASAAFILFIRFAKPEELIGRFILRVI